MSTSKPASDRLATGDKKQILELTYEGMTPTQIWNYLQNSRSSQWITLGQIKKFVSRKGASYQHALNAENELEQKIEEAGLDPVRDGIQPLMKELIRFKAARQEFDYPDDPQEILELFRSIAENQVIQFKTDPLLFGICTKVHQNILDAQMRLREHEQKMDTGGEDMQITFNLSVKE